MIKEYAREKLSKKLENVHISKPFSFIEGNELVELLEGYMPSAFWQEYDYFTKYFNALKTDFARIKDISAIGQKEPVPLENIYVSLRLTGTAKERVIPVEKERKIIEEKLEKKDYTKTFTADVVLVDRKIIEDELIEKELERPAERARVLDAERAITDYNKLVFVGAPGSGKTTLLKHLALKSCTENLKVL
ncbi:MAG: hypothetical protein IMF19_05115, partial [Proteobacteria bacterium]|nr:hypothetical protein [Pseudomonadota bacterium]